MKLKKYYQPNIEKYGESAILVDVGANPLNFKSKTMKRQPNSETYVGSYDCCLYVCDLIGYGPKLSLQLKHFNYEVNEFSLVESDQAYKIEEHIFSQIKKRKYESNK